ncbi:hypothetical protein KEM56_007787, partial [Ascosphaera pollenicola]
SSREHPAPIRESSALHLSTFVQRCRNKGHGHLACLLSVQAAKYSNRRMARNGLSKRVSRAWIPCRIGGVVSLGCSLLMRRRTRRSAI